MISKRISAGFEETSRLKLKRHLCNMHVPKKLVNAIRENTMDDRKGDFKQEWSLRRLGKIPISQTSNVLVGMVSVYYGDEGDFLHMQATSSRYSMIIFAGETRRNNRLIK